MMGATPVGTVVDRLLDAVCFYYSVKREHVLSARRSHAAVLARQQAAAAMAATGRWSRVEVAAQLGVDHSTIGAIMARHERSLSDLDYVVISNRLIKEVRREIGTS